MQLFSAILNLRWICFCALDTFSSLNVFHDWCPDRGYLCDCNNPNWWWVQTRHSLIFDTLFWPARPPSLKATLHLAWAATAPPLSEWNISHIVWLILKMFSTKFEPFIAFINFSQKNSPRMFNISLILLFVATGYLLGQRYSSSFSVNPNIVWLRTVFVTWKISLILAT